MFKRFKILLWIITFSVFCTGCTTYGDMIKNLEKSSQAAREKRIQEHNARVIAAEEEQRKNHGKKVLDRFLKNDPALSSDPVIKSLIGEYKGSTCNGKTDVAINISNAFTLTADSSHIVFVFGKLRATDPQGRNIEIHIKGKLDKATGLLTMHSSKQPTFREFIALTFSNDKQGIQLLLDAVANDNSRLDEFEKKFESRKLDDDGTIAPPMIAVDMNLTRDSAGKGWVGSFEADGFEDCHELAMMSKVGNSTNMLPPVTTGLEIHFSNLVKPLHSKIYWLKVAEKSVKVSEKAEYFNIEIPIMIAKTYVGMGAKSTQYYRLALEYYLRSANQFGDARAQIALAKMYRRGMGASIDTAEADKWQALADKTYMQATKICSSPKTLTAMYTILEMDAQRARKMGRLLTVVSGIRFEPGLTKITFISASDVTSVDRPFRCLTHGKTIDRQIDASAIPDFVYAGTDGFGRDYVYDKTFEKSMINVVGAILKDLPFHPTFNIHKIEGQKYYISGPDSGSTEIDLR